MSMISSCAGAEPLFFLIISLGTPGMREGFKAVVKGITAGCRMAGCAFVNGGERRRNAWVCTGADSNT